MQACAFGKPLCLWHPCAFSIPYAFGTTCAKPTWPLVERHDACLAQTHPSPAEATGQPLNRGDSSLQPQITPVNHQVAAEIAAPLVAAPSHGLVAFSTLPPQGPSDDAILEQIHSLPPLPPHLMYAPASRAGTNGQGRERDRANKTQTSASRTLSLSTIHSRLGSQRARVREQLLDERNDRHSLTRSRTNLRRQLVEESSQTQSINLPHEQGNQGGQPLQIDEEAKWATLINTSPDVRQTGHSHRHVSGRMPNGPLSSTRLRTYAKRATLIDTSPDVRQMGHSHRHVSGRTPNGPHSSTCLRTYAKWATLIDMSPDVRQTSHTHRHVSGRTPNGPLSSTRLRTYAKRATLIDTSPDVGQTGHSHRHVSERRPNGPH
ncbi:hypothetical protein ACE6H2_002078 [Prunus campanulata]